MITDGVHECTKPFGLTQTAIFAQNSEDPCEGLLAHVLDHVQRLEARAKLNPE
jgi:hypothetical protein